MNHENSLKNNNSIIVSFKSENLNFQKLEPTPNTSSELISRFYRIFQLIKLCPIFLYLIW